MNQQQTYRGQFLMLDGAECSEMLQARFERERFEGLYHGGFDSITSML